MSRRLTPLVLVLLMTQILLAPAVAGDLFEKDMTSSVTVGLDFANGRAANMSMNFADGDNFTSDIDLWQPFYNATGEAGRLSHSFLPPSVARIPIYNTDVIPTMDSYGAYFISPVKFDYDSILAGASECWIRAPFLVNSSAEWYLGLTIIHTNQYVPPRPYITPRTGNWQEKDNWTLEFPYWRTNNQRPRITTSDFYDGEEMQTVYRGNWTTTAAFPSQWAPPGSPWTDPWAYRRGHDHRALRQLNSTVSNGTANYTYNFTYVNVKAPLYAGEGYYFVWFYYANDTYMNLLVTGSDMYADALEYTRVRNWTGTYGPPFGPIYDEWDVEIDLSMDILFTQGMSAGVTGFHIPAHPLAGPSWGFQYDIYIAAGSIAQYDYFTFSMPFTNAFNGSLWIYLTPIDSTGTYQTGFTNTTNYWDPRGFIIFTCMNLYSGTIHGYNVIITLENEQDTYVHLYDKNIDFDENNSRYPGTSNPATWDKIRDNTSCLFYQRTGDLGLNWKESLGFQPVSYIQRTDGIWLNAYIAPITIYLNDTEEVEPEQVNVTDGIEYQIWVSPNGTPITAEYITRKEALLIGNAKIIYVIKEYTFSAVEWLADKIVDVLGWEIDYYPGMILDKIYNVLDTLGDFLFSIVGYIRVLVDLAVPTLEYLFNNAVEILIISVTLFAVPAILAAFERVFRLPVLIGVYGFQPAMEFAAERYRRFELMARSMLTRGAS